MVMIDFPGYGFAYMTPEISKQIRELCTSYLLGNRKSLKRVLLLVDARHGLKIGDKNYFKELLYGSTEDTSFLDDTLSGICHRHGSLFRYLMNALITEGAREKISASERRAGIHWKLQIVLTKCDLVPRADLARRCVIIRNELTEALPGFSNMLPIMFVSGNELKGIVELQRELASLVRTPASQTKNPSSTGSKSAMTRPDENSDGSVPAATDVSRTSDRSKVSQLSRSRMPAGGISDGSSPSRLVPSGRTDEIDNRKFIRTASRPVANSPPSRKESPRVDSDVRSKANDIRRK
jgi:GTP-binding protein EngB required for normal cell division